jgi:hypothetical protein
MRRFDKFLRRSYPNETNNKSNNNIQFKILLILLCITDAKFGSGKAWPYLIVDHQKRRLVHFLQ